MKVHEWGYTVTLEYSNVALADAVDKEIQAWVECQILLENEEPIRAMWGPPIGATSWPLDRTQAAATVSVYTGG